MKKIRKTVAIVLAIVMALAFSCTAFAADTDTNSSVVAVLTDEDIMPASTMTTYVLNTSGTFSAYHRETFTLSSKSTITAIYSIKGIGHTNDITLLVSNTTNGKTYYSTTFSATSGGHSKVLSDLPAGTYEVVAFGNGDFAFSYMFHY